MSSSPPPPNSSPPINSSSSPQHNYFGIRIVALDYYLTKPVDDVDVTKSLFNGTRLTEVPVIRIFGGSIMGQPTCLHIHQVIIFIVLIFYDFYLFPSS